MPGPKKMKDFAERKRLLVAEADLHRTFLQVEVTRCQSRLDSMRQGVRTGGPWLAAGSAIAGVLLARKWRSLAGVIPGALAAWRWYRKFKGR